MTIKSIIAAFVFAFVVAPVEASQQAASQQNATHAAAKAEAPSDITVRTEDFPRPPYSGAVYYIYERDGQTLCTKLEVCNKFNECTVTYEKGAFKDEEDIETGDPSGRTEPAAIAQAKLKKHLCLTKFRIR